MCVCDKDSARSSVHLFIILFRCHSQRVRCIEQAAQSVLGATEALDGATTVGAEFDVFTKRQRLSRRTGKVAVCFGSRRAGTIRNHASTALPSIPETEQDGRSRSVVRFVVALFSIPRRQARKVWAAPCLIRLLLNTAKRSSAAAERRWRCGLFPFRRQRNSSTASPYFSISSSTPCGTTDRRALRSQPVRHRRIHRGTDTRGGVGGGRARTLVPRGGLGRGGTRGR